ncbi:hypothetical protein HYY71_02850 [Candidatus Woesearchaeota archaeon]|nr:hypothetical protein [Candidatus Woesearchaeota archaeon]
MIKKKLFKFLILILSFVLVINIVYAEEFEVNKITYTLLYFYKCQDGQTRLNSEQFSSFTKSVENNPILKEKFNVWGDNSLAIKSFDFFSDGNNVFLRNTSRFKIKFDEKSIAYISLNSDYWFVTYDLDFSGEDFNLGQRLNSLALKNNAGVSEYVRNGLYKFSCGEQPGMLIYNIHDYNGSIECLNADKDIYECLNDDNYNKLTQKLDFSKIDKKEDRIHEPFYNQKIIMDKRHLGNDIENTVTRMIILSDTKIMDYGIIHYTTYEGLIEYLLNLRKMPPLINNLKKLNSKYRNLSFYSEDLLNKLKSYSFLSYSKINVTLIDDLQTQFISGEEELSVLPTTPKIINDKLKIGNRFYLDYYTKFSNFYLDEYYTIFKDTKDKVAEIKINIEKMREVKSDKRDTFISFSIGFIAVILVVLQLFLYHSYEKKNDKKYLYFQRKINEVIKGLNQNRRR